MLYAEQVLMAASKRTTFSGGSPMAQLANQAAVLENGDSDVVAAPAVVTAQNGPAKAAWERFKGYLAGLVAALITTLYTVSLALKCSVHEECSTDCSALHIWPLVALLGVSASPALHGTKQVSNVEPTPAA